MFKCAYAFHSARRFTSFRQVPHTAHSAYRLFFDVYCAFHLQVRVSQYFRYCIIIVSIVLSVFILPVVLTSFPQASHAGSSFLWCSCSNVQAEECLHYTRRVHVTVLSCCYRAVFVSCCVYRDLAVFVILLPFISCCLWYLAFFVILLSLISWCLFYGAVFVIVGIA